MNKLILIAGFIGGLAVGATAGVLATKHHYQNKADEEIRTMSEYYSSKKKEAQNNTPTIPDVVEPNPRHHIEPPVLEEATPEPFDENKTEPFFVDKDTVILDETDIECDALTLYVNDDVLIDEYLNEEIIGQESERMLGDCRFRICDTDVYYVYSPYYHVYYEVYATAEPYVRSEYYVDPPDDQPQRERILNKRRPEQ